MSILISSLQILANSAELSKYVRQGPPDLQRHPRLEQVAAACKGVSDELLSTLQKLNVAGGSHRKWQSFRHALAAVGKADRIETLRRRLESLRDQLNVQIVTLTKYVISDHLYIVVFFFESEGLEAIKITCNDTCCDSKESRCFVTPCVFSLSHPRSYNYH
jgi:hypothetical protein